MLEGKIAIVTGASKGIGKATALKMSESGATVYACSRSKADYYNDQIIYHELDVTDPASCEMLFNDVKEKHGKIDILVCNAGITSDAMTAKMSSESFDSVIDTNLKGIFNLVRFIGPFMETQGYGSIVAISSVVGE